MLEMLSSPEVQQPGRVRNDELTRISCVCVRFRISAKQNDIILFRLSCPYTNPPNRLKRTLTVTDSTFIILYTCGSLRICLRWGPKNSSTVQPDTKLKIIISCLRSECILKHHNNIEIKAKLVLMVQIYNRIKLFPYRYGSKREWSGVYPFG